MNPSQKKLFVTLGIFGALAVVLGAFGSHSLKALLSEKSLSTYKIGVQYHFNHLVLLGILAILFSKYDQKEFKTAFIVACFGILLFSGSLYLLATRSLLGIESWTFLGPLTPIGGLCFIASWILLIIGIKRIK